MVAATLVFAVAYVALAAGRLPYVSLDRPAAALLGAVAMVVIGGLPLHQAYAAVDMGVLGLLFGMMLLASYLTEAHFFRYTAYLVLTRARSARSLLWGLVLTSGLLSAFLLNDTICLMFTPLVLAVVAEARLPPLPYLLGLAAATNVGGVVTLTGNPQNMIIGERAAGLVSYLGYLTRVLPAGLLGLVALAWLLCFLFRHELPPGPLPARHPRRPYLDRTLASLALALLALFVLLASLNVSLSGAAIFCASVLVLLARKPPRPILARVDWSLLLLFAGLFVLVEGLERSGALARLLEHAHPLLGRPGAIGDALFAGITVIGSNLVSNVPFVMVAVDWIPALPEPAWRYTLLAVASTLAGNLTLVGSVANLIVFESAGPIGEISALRFFRYGLPITAVTLAIALGVLWAQRALGW